MPNIETSLFRIDIPTGNPKSGRLLVAEPFLREEYFNHAVILLVECEPGEKTMGLVLNKPTNITLGQAIEGIDDEVDIPIFCGGPVANDRLFYIHSLPEEFPGSQRVGKNLYIGGDYDRVKSYIHMGLPTDGKIRFFVGYSGWDSGQLEDEMQAHVWAVSASTARMNILEAEGESFWYKVVKEMGPSYRNWLYHPTNPEMN